MVDLLMDGFNPRPHHTESNDVEPPPPQVVYGSRVQRLRRIEFVRWREPRPLLVHDVHPVEEPGAAVAVDKVSGGRVNSNGVQWSNSNQIRCPGGIPCSQAGNGCQRKA